MGFCLPWGRCQDGPYCAPTVFWQGILSWLPTSLALRHQVIHVTSPWDVHHCGGLNEECSPSLRHLSTWSLVSGVRGGCGILERWSLARRSIWCGEGFQSVYGFSLISISSPHFVLMVEKGTVSYLLLSSCLLLVAMTPTIMDSYPSWTVCPSKRFFLEPNF